MIFRETALRGAWIVDPEPVEDARGCFARVWSPDDFARHGLRVPPAHASVSFNHRRGTLRGMHWQAPPHAEVKLVRCTRGRVQDVIVDLRPGSPTRGEWFGVELSETNRRQLYVPEGFAHGFQTLEDGCEVLYQISVPYRPESGRGVRYSDPLFGIEWPLEVTVISDRDRDFPLVDPAAWRDWRSDG